MSDSRMSACGRKRPLKSAVFGQLERPLLRKADIQIREMKNRELKGRNTPGSGDSVLPKAVESICCQLRVSDRMRDVLVTQILLNRSRVMPVIRQLVAASMAEHVRVNGKRYGSISAGSRYDFPD